MPLFVFIAGASGSGKSYLSKLLAKELSSRDIACNFLSMDDYFNPRPAHIKSQNELKKYQSECNFDCPDALDFDLFHRHLKKLDKGMALADKPIYSFHESNRLDKTERFEAKDVVIIEGLFALHDLRRLKLKKKITVFVESDSYQAYQRQRTDRDIRERGFTEERVKSHERKSVRPGFFRYVAPTKSTADLVIVNNPSNQQLNQGLSLLIDQIQNNLHSKVTSLHGVC